jgi:hypothetical protein
LSTVDVIAGFVVEEADGCVLEFVAGAGYQKLDGECLPFAFQFTGWAWV